MAAPAGGKAGKSRDDAQRWRLQRAAQTLMSRPGRWPLLGDWKEKRKHDGTPIWVPAYRVVMCHRWTSGSGPALWRSPDGGAADFSEVHTCGSVWACPICAAKITSGRRVELVAAVGGWEGRGGAVYLVTRTASHGKQHELTVWLDKFGEALSRVKGTRRERAVSVRAGVVGAIRALEVTHGEMNGWHPHTHELVFARPGERGRLLSLRNGWIRELIKRDLAGMRDTMTRAERAEQLRFLRRHALTVQDGGKAAEYIAKFGMEATTDQGGRWGPASELVKGHQKLGERLSGRTPFALLRLYADGDQRAGHLFRDFIKTFSGKAQLYWSPGLRAALAECCDEAGKQIYFRDGATDEAAAWSLRARTIARDMADEDLAASKRKQCSEFVYRLGAEDWRAVLRTNSRHDLLMAAQLGGEAEVIELLARLRAERASHDDYYVADFRRWDRGR